jgi:hypothetical protein
MSTTKIIGREYLTKYAFWLCPVGPIDKGNQFTGDLLEPEEPSSSFVASYQPHSAVTVVFQNHKDRVMRAAGILWVPAMRSRDILQQAKEDHLD